MAVSQWSRFWKWRVRFWGIWSLKWQLPQLSVFWGMIYFLANHINVHHTLFFCRSLFSSSFFRFALYACRRFVRAAQESSDVSVLQMEFLSGYVAELSLLDYGMLCYAPSTIAASAIFLAKLMLLPKKLPWVWTMLFVFLLNMWKTD